MHSIPSFNAPMQCNMSMGSTYTHQLVPHHGPLLRRGSSAAYALHPLALLQVLPWQTALPAYVGHA